MIASLQSLMAEASNAPPTTSEIDNDAVAGVTSIFGALEKHSDPKQRGFEFERLLQRLFRLSGYETERNPVIARPRQTDLLAKYGENLFLIEAKWQRDPIDIAHIDDLHARLRRAPRSAVACLFSMSAFTQNAIDRVKELRRAEHGHEILLFDPFEVTALMRGWMQLKVLLANKHRALRELGEVLFLREHPKRPPLQPLDIPMPQPQVLRPNDLRSSFVGDVYNFAFGDLPAMFNVHEDQTRVFHLHGRVHVQDFDELVGLLHLFHSRLGLLGTGGYTITELKNQRVWVGTSAADFVRNLAKLDERYAAAAIKVSHHSEEFTFYDATGDGAILVTGRQNVSRRNLDDVWFELFLPGIPLEMEPVRSVARALGLQYGLLLPMHRTPMQRVILPREGVLVEPLEYLRSNDDPSFISGAVVRNPFFGKRKTLRDLPHPLYASSVLVGSVHDHLGEDERVTKFRVRHIDVLTTNDGWVVDVMLKHDEKLRYNVPVEVDRSAPIVAKPARHKRTSPARSNTRRSK